MADDQPLTDLERTLPPHLGGHFGNTNIDTATLDELIRRYGVRTMLDVGCGPGGMIEAALARGVEAYGIDGDPHLARARIWVHDYTKGAWPAHGWDLVWCTEFVEHVEAQYQDNYLATFDGGRVLFLTAAPPDFPGHHHVNCQPDWYWVGLLDQRGWVLDTEATQWVRQNGGHPFSTRQGLVFVKSSSPRLPRTTT
jgi:SAM-dependent methyltransferase